MAAKPKVSVVQEQVVEFKLDRNSLMTVRIRVGSTDIQVPKPPPRPKYCGLLELGNGEFAEITVDVTRP